MDTAARRHCRQRHPAALASLPSCPPALLHPTSSAQLPPKPQTHPPTPPHPHPQVPDALLPDEAVEALVAERRPRFVGLDGAELASQPVGPTPPGHGGVVQLRLSNGIKARAGGPGSRGVELAGPTVQGCTLASRPANGVHGRPAFCPPIDLSQQTRRCTHSPHPPTQPTLYIPIRRSTIGAPTTSRAAPCCA